MSPPHPPRALQPITSTPVCKAAILLSASIAFLSLPGLDGIARVAALVVVLLAACAMASSLVALFRFKAELTEAAQPTTAAQLNPAVGREGLMLISVSDSSSYSFSISRSLGSPLR